MKRYPHKPDAADLVDLRARIRAEYDELIGDVAKHVREGNGLYPQLVSEYALDLAGFAYAFDEPLTHVNEWLKSAAQLARDAFTTGLELTPEEFGTYVAVGLVSRDRQLVDLLRHATRDRFTHSEERAPEMAYGCIEALLDVLAGRHNAAFAKVDGARLTTRSERPWRGLVALVAAVASKEQAAFEAALVERQMDHKQRHARSAAGQALLDITALAVVLLGIEAGLSFTADSVYLPKALIDLR